MSDKLSNIRNERERHFASIFFDHDEWEHHPQTIVFKEIPITFKCDEHFRDWLGREAAILDLSISETVRAALLLAIPQMQRIRGLSRIDLEDMRNDGRSQ